MALLKNKRLVIIIAAVLVVLLGGGAYWVSTRFLREAPVKRIDETLLQVDDYISTGYYTQAADLLSELKGFSGSARNWLRILKRANTLYEHIEDASVLNTLSRAAVEDIPGNEHLWAVRVYTELLQGKYEDAYEHGAEHLTEDMFDTLTTESYIRYTQTHERDLAPEELQQYNKLFLGFKNRDPQAFRQAAEVTDNERFTLLAAILYMSRGKPETAFELIEKIPTEIDPRLHFYISYDSGHYQTASSILGKLQEDEAQSRMELLFLEADLYMLQKEYNKAKAIYQQIIDEDPRHSWIPYLNLSWISSEQEKTFDFEYIKQAYEMFPEKKEILLPLVWYSMEQNRGQDYEQDLKQYLEEHPDDPDIRLLYLTVSSTMNNPAKYKAALWQLYNQYPGNANIAQYLCWYLFGMEDFEDVRTVLQRFENEAGTMEWIDFYRGAMASLQGNREKAVEHYASSLEIEERWETHYNLGLLHLKTGYRDRALEQFRRAEALVKRSETTLRSNKKHAGIYIKIAMIHFLNEDYEQAERQLNFGLEIDSGNLEGHLLAKKLEAATKR